MKLNRVYIKRAGGEIASEAHSGFALGAYDLDPVRYADLLEARWLELAGIA